MKGVSMSKTSDEKSFRDVPVAVWKLVDEILHYGQPVQLFESGTERSLAYSVAWGWNPPLIKPGDKSELTEHGLAAYAWRQLQLREQGAQVNELGIVPRCSETGEVNLDGYIPYSDVWQEHFDSYGKAKRFLEKQPEIRTAKPSANRLLVHAGDWLTYWKKQEGRVPTDEEIDTYLAGAKQRHEELRRKKDAQFRAE
jgi:hypothetical protein